MRKLVSVVLGAMLVVFVAGCGGQSAQTPGSSEKAQDPDPTLGEDAELTSDQPATPEPPPGAVPDYTVAESRETAEGPFDVAAYRVVTEATSERDLRAITVELRAENPEKEAVLVNFYPEEGPDADLSGTGEAFVDSRAASAVLGSAYTRRDVERIMDDDGLLVVAAESSETTQLAG